MAISQAEQAFLNHINGGGSGMGFGPTGSGGGGGGGGSQYGGMTEEEFIAYLNSLPEQNTSPFVPYSTPNDPYDPYANYPVQYGGLRPGEGTPSGILYDQLNNPDRPGYMHTGGGSGYIHGNPEDEQRAWQLFLDMKRNGWDPYAPGSLEEARRGMGEFTNEAFNEYFQNFLYDQKAKDPKGGEGTPKLGKWNDWLVSALGKGKLGKLGLGKWLKNAQEGATFDDWLQSLDPNQTSYIDEWMIGLGADKNWEDRLRAGEAPWSRTGEAIDKTQRQNPAADDGVNREDDRPSPGGGPRGPKDPKGGEEEPEPSYSGPVGLPAYGGQPYQPTFVGYQPYNTNGPVQMVPGRR